MKNVDKQSSIENKLKRQYEITGIDLNGKMYFCKVCEYKTKEGCKFAETNSIKDRIIKTACATSYNRFSRK